MMKRVSPIFILCTFVLTFVIFPGTVHAADDPLFDFDEIVNEPLRAKTLHEKKTEGIVVQEIEYDGGRMDGQPVRVFGILAYIHAHIEGTA